MSDTFDVVYPDFSAEDAFATFGLTKYLRFTAKAFPANNFTITFWFKPGSSGTLLFYGDPNGASSFNSINTTMEVRQNGDGLEIDFKSASQNSTTISINVGGTDPHFIALRFAQTGDTASIQVNVDNGAPQAFTVQLINSEQNPVTLAAGDLLSIGARMPDSEGHVNFLDVYTGIITDLRVWKHVMTEAEILEDSLREVYGDEQDLCLALPLDADNINIDVNTADNLVGDISDDPTFLSVGDQPGWVVVDAFPMPENTRTIEWWMRCGANDNGYILNYDDISNTDHPNDPSNNLIIAYSGGIEINNRPTGINFTDGEWHHIALVFTDTTETYYLDGFQVGNAQPRSFDALLTPRKLIMGIQSVDTNDYAFGGQIQRFFVWNTALSADDVLDRALLTEITSEQTPNIAGALTLTSATINNIPSTSYSTSMGLVYKPDVQPLSDGVNWFRDQKIFSRTTLTDDFVLNDTGELVTKPVYRVSITCSSLVQALYITAVDVADISINDGPIVNISNVSNATAVPNIYGKVQITIAATDVRCAALRVRTDLMAVGDYHYIFPDIEVHKKIVQMPAHAFSTADARSALGIDPNLTTVQLDGFQTAIRNIASTVQHTYNRTQHSVTHDRNMLPVNMQDTHFKFEFSKNAQPAFNYTPMSKADISAAVANAQKINVLPQPGFFSTAIADLIRAETIFVHTIENIGGAIADGVDQASKDIVGAVQQVGEDITHGDILYAAQDLIRGGENLSADLTRTSAGVVTAAVKGAGQLLALTIQIGEDMYQYFISHTGDVGRIISALFQKISSSIDKVINWLKDKFYVADTLNTYNNLLTYFNSSFDTSSTLLNSLKQNLNTYLDGLTVGLKTNVDKQMAGYTLAPISNTRTTHPAHSASLEKVEWMIGKIHRAATSGNPVQMPAASTAQSDNINAIFNAIYQKFGDEGDGLIKYFDKSQLSDFFTLVASGANAAGYIISAFWKLVQTVIADGLALLKTILDKIIDLVMDMLATLKNALQATLDLGIVNTIFKFFTGDTTMSAMKLGTLLLAIPLTMFEKSVMGQVPFNANPVEPRTETMFLNAPLPKSAVDYGLVYGIFHVALGPMSLYGDVKALVNIATGANAPSSKLTTWVSGLKSKTLETPAYSDSVITIINAFLSVGAQFIGNPVPPNKQYALPSSSEVNDPKLAPNYYAHVIWLYQWFGWGGHYVPTFFSLGLYKFPGAQTAFSYIIPVYDTLFGTFHIWLMATLDGADRNRIRALLIDKDAGRTLDQDEQNYLNWATADNTLQIWNAQTQTLTIPVPSPLSRKTFGNICDCIPEISQLGLFPSIIKWTKGYSLLGTMLLDAFGQIGEGSTVIVRTVNNELY